MFGTFVKKACESLQLVHVIPVTIVDLPRQYMARIQGEEWFGIILTEIGIIYTIFLRIMFSKRAEVGNTTDSWHRMWPISLKIQTHNTKYKHTIMNMNTQY